MIKGLSRQAIVLIPDKTDVFDKVIFLVNPQSSGKRISQEEMLEEALRIIERNTSYNLSKKRRTSQFKRD